MTYTRIAYDVADGVALIELTIRPRTPTPTR